jgi:hypothetical protein
MMEYEQKIIDDEKNVVSNARKRVYYALPHWKKWPRRLRRVYALLSQFGCSDLAIKDIAREFDWDPDETLEMIEDEPTFKAELEAYRQTGEYPRKTTKEGKPWKNPLSREYMEIVLVDEDGLAQLLHVENARASGKAGIEYALKRIEQRGYLDDVKSIAEEPEQVLQRQMKVTGYDIEPEMIERLRERPTTSGLEWDLPEPEEESKNGGKPVQTPR